ncbi:MAG: hypothetical protein GX273_09550 [Bacteroidales bacterium]|nr:hypothetical protein [Bacteroidales bacterium]
MQNPITNYKNNIAERILTNNNIVRALVNTDSDFLNQALPNNFEPYTLLYKQIFPFAFVPGINAEDKTFITMAFNDFRYVNNVFKEGTVSFYVFTHNNLIPTKYGLRYDYISYQLDKMFNKKYGIGAFSLDIEGGGDLQVSENYFGVMLSYKFTDFQ